MQGILKPFEVRDRRTKERFFLDDAYLNGWAKRCGIYATGVYVSLCRHANTEQYCWPSIKKLAEEHAISSRQVHYALKELKKYRIIEVERLGKKLNNRYWLTDKSEWQDMPITNKSDTHNMHITTAPYAHHPLHNMHIHSKDTHSKDTHIRLAADAAKKDMIRQKDENEHGDDNLPVINMDTGEREVVTPLKPALPVLDLLRLFQPVNPSYYLFTRNKTEIAAIKRLRDTYGTEKLSALIQALPEIISKPYAPRITSPYQLETQMGKLKAFIDQEEAKIPAIVKI
jgi:hypothetical protein